MPRCVNPRFHMMPTACLAVALASGSVTAAGEEAVVPLAPVEVTGTPLSYAVPAASVGTKTDTPIMETPLSVQVLPRQLIQDQKATTLDQVLNNASGVRSSNIGWAENIYIRGFSTSTYLRDGFRIDDPSGLGGLLYLSNVERIEVLKGPGSILYGQVEPGGVVNLVTKRPQTKALYSLEQDFGSWNRYITTVDATGPIDNDQTLLYRINFSYDTGDFWVDNVKNTRTFVAPTLQWKPDALTEVTFEVTYSQNRQTLYQQAVVPYDTTTQQFQWGSRSANPAPYYFNPNTTFVGLNWSRQLNDAWTIKQLIAYNQTNFSTPLNLSTAWGPLTLEGDTWTVGLGTAQLSGQTTSAGTVVDLVGHFQTGAARHTLLIGADYYALKANYDSRYSSPSGPFVYVPLFSSNVPSADGIPLDPDTTYYTNTTTKSWGAYIQDQIRLPWNIDVLAGLRYQNVESSGYSISGANFGGTGERVDSTPSNEHAVTPRVGVLWRPQQWLSLYASYTENFGAANAALGPDWQGNPLKPESASQYEVGLKTELSGGKAFFTFAWFDLTKSNVAANDLAHPNGQGGFYPTTVGEIESKGVELTLQGEILPGWNLLAAYSYDPVTVKQGTQIYPAGSAMPFVPNNLARLFTTYSFASAPLTGLKIGGGLTWQSSAPGVYTDPNTGVTDTTTIRSPGYTIFEVMASYDFRAWNQLASIQLNVNNLFNRSYYTDAFMYVAPWGYVTYGAPRSAMLSLKVTL